MYAPRKPRKPPTHTEHRNVFCFSNFKKYLQETSLHGLRFVGDDSLTIWERAFFLCTLICAFVSTVHLIDYIYEKWISVPIIIGANPYATSISDIPFPAITLCNVNQLMDSKVNKYSNNSYERELTDMACFKTNSNIAREYSNKNYSLSDFIVDHAQPCSRLILSCSFNSKKEYCTDLFRESITDEGLCCVFNVIHPDFRYKKKFDVIQNYTHAEEVTPINWTPEIGYPQELPKKYYPRKGAGIGIGMGLDIIVNAELDDYYCSSTNGPGVKISLHSPTETPGIRDLGFVVGIGNEVRIRIDPRSSTAAPSIRSLKPRDRLCLFSNEGDLLYYKIYTRRNCEDECQAHAIYDACKCLPYTLPLVYENATICGPREAFCANKAFIEWLRKKQGPCREKCLGNCFDIGYSATAFSTPLVQGSYPIQDEELRNMTHEYIKKNIAVLHFYYHEFSFHGNVRNVYVGFTEFVSTTGNILGLFLGFSFISLAELFYFALIRPIFWWKRPTTTTKIAAIKEIPTEINWIDKEIGQPQDHVFHISTVSNFWNSDKSLTTPTKWAKKPTKRLQNHRKLPGIKK